MKEVDTSILVVHERDNNKPPDFVQFKDLKIGEAFAVGRNNEDALLIKVGDGPKSNVWYPVKGLFLDYDSSIATHRRRILRIVVEEL